MGELLRGIVSSIVRGDDEAGTERIRNGGFANGDNWTITGAKWTIGSGVASEVSTGNGLNQTLESTITAGQPYILRCDIGGACQGIQVIFTSGGTPTETIFGGIPIFGRIAQSGHAVADFDGVRFQTTSAGTTTIDNVSLIV